MNLFYEKLALATTGEDDAIDITNILREELRPHCTTDLRDLWEGMNNGANIFVARDRDLPRRNGFTIVGMGILTFKWQPGQWTAFIDDVATLHAYRGNGIASMIIGMMLELMQEEEVRLVRLTTRRPAARRLYEERLGFRVAQTTLLEKHVESVPDDEPLPAA